MESYEKIVKRKMLKNEYLNNTFNFYKRIIFSILLSVICIGLCFVLIINLSKVTTHKLNPKIVIVEGYGKDSKKEKALYEFANKYESIDFLIYDNSFKRNDLVNLEVLQSYRIPIHLYNSSVVYFKQAYIFIDEYGKVKYYRFDDTAFDNGGKFLNLELLASKIEEYGW